MQANLQQRILVRLFRLWATARDQGEETLGSMHKATQELRLPDHASSTCDSLFTLLEGIVGRRLVREGPCALHLSPDEVALIGVIEVAPSIGALRGSQEVPHGLPGAVRWAAMSVRDAMNWPPRSESIPSLPRAARACPFSDGGARLVP